MTLLEETMEKLSGLCDWHDREAFKRVLKEALEKATKQGHSQGWNDSFDEYQPF